MVSAPKKSTETMSSSLIRPRSRDGISRITAATSAPPAANSHVLGPLTTQKMIHGTEPRNDLAPIALTSHTSPPGAVESAAHAYRALVSARRRDGSIDCVSGVD